MQPFFQKGGRSHLRASARHPIRRFVRGNPRVSGPPTWKPLEAQVLLSSWRCVHDMYASFSAKPHCDRYCTLNSHG